MQECYNERLNLLMHGVAEKSWETKDQTKIVLKIFLFNGLLLDPEEIGVIDVHRLPQTTNPKSLYKARPIIVKLATAFDKHSIMRSLKHLRQYNDTQDDDSPHSSTPNDYVEPRKRNIYVTEHLPKFFLDQKKKLMPDY